MKFTIKDVEYQKVITQREIEIEFPYYYKIYKDDEYKDERGALMPTSSETYGVIHKSVLSGRDVHLSVWQITYTSDGRQSFESSWKVEQESFAPFSIITEDILKGGITREEFEMGKNEAIDEMTQMTIYIDNKSAQVDTNS